MNLPLSELAASIKSSSARVKDTFGGLSEAQLNWKPSAEKWSIGECIGHLIVTNKQYFPALEEIVKGEHKNSLWQNISPLSGLWGKMLLKVVSPDYEKKTKTAGIFQPSSSNISAAIFGNFIQCNDEFISYLNKLGSIDLKKVKIYSPVNKFITYSLLDALKIITFHEIRHINQAERVMKAESFPKK